MPFIIVFTKVDSCPPEVREDNLKSVVSLLKSKAVNKTPFKVKSIKDVVVTIKPFTHKKIVPIFQVSNVSGENIDLLTLFFNYIQSYKSKVDDAENQDKDTPSLICEVILKLSCF